MARRDEDFAAFMAESSPALLHTAWLLCGNAHRAEELTQQALVKTYVSWARALRTDPLAYARRTLANQRIDTWRRTRREVLLAPEDMPAQVQSADFARATDRDLLARALATLPARQRRIVVLRHFIGLSEAEVADDLGVSVGTVKSTASRALSALRAQLGEASTAPAPRGGTP